MKMKSTKRALAAAGLAAAGLAALMLAIPTAALAGDTPPGFYYGSDTNGPGPVGSGVEYTFKNCGGAFGNYIGRVDSANDSDNKEGYSNAANANAINGYGLGSDNYYVLSGPTDDDATTAAEALAYGEQQGDAAMSNVSGFYNSSGVEAPAYDPIIYADVEQYNGDGWSSTSLNRDVFNGFFDVIDGSYVDIQGVYYPTFVGIYTQPDIVGGILSGSVPKTFEWTNQNSYLTYGPGECASSWDSGSMTAQFFMGDGQGAACAVAYQYISGSADYNQVDYARIVAGEDDGTCT